MIAFVRDCISYPQANILFKTYSALKISKRMEALLNHENVVLGIFSSMEIHPILACSKVNKKWNNTLATLLLKKKVLFQVTQYDGDYISWNNFLEMNPLAVEYLEVQK